MTPRATVAAAAAAKKSSSGHVQASSTAAGKKKRTPNTPSAEAESSSAPARATTTSTRRKRASTTEPEATSSQKNSPAQGSTNGFDAGSVLPSAKRARRGSIDSDAAPATTSSPRRSLARVRGSISHPRGSGASFASRQPRLGMNPLPRPIPLLGPDALRIDEAARLSNAHVAFASFNPAFSFGNSDILSQYSLTTPSKTVLPRNLLVWGSADSGQLGLGPDVTDEIPRPKLHEPLAQDLATGSAWSSEGIEVAVAGGMHTLVIDASGTLWSWGVNDNAALGRLTTRDPSVPSDVSESIPHRVEGLGPDGKGVDPKTGEVADVTVFRATRAASTDCACVALSEVGELRCWGSFRSNEGLLGFESTRGASKMQYSPVSIPALSKYSISDVAAGENHFLALTTEGVLFAWGNGEQAQLGRKILHRRKLNALTPERLGIKKVRLIGSGAYHSFAVDASENAWVWGLNMRHQSGLNLARGDMIETPTLIPTLSRSHPSCKLPDGVTIIQIAAGSAHSLFLLSNGDVLGCGRSDGGEIGLADDHEVMRDIQVLKEEWKAERSKELESELAEWSKKMAVREQERGMASQGGEAAGFNLGVGAAANVDDLPPTMGAPPDEFVGVPTRIPFPTEEDEQGSAVPASIVQISCGARFNMAISSRGKLYAWGTGPSCELGLGADVDQVGVPTLVRSVEFKKKGWVPVSVSAGGQHCVALAVNPGGQASAAAATSSTA